MLRGAFLAMIVRRVATILALLDTKMQSLYNRIATREVQRMMMMG